MAQIQAPSQNYISQGQHGSYNAVDYGARTSRLIPTMNRKEIYAVEDGKITSYGWHPTMGNRLELTSRDGKRRWGFGHLEAARVKNGQEVKRGQLIGIMGYTGYTIPSGYYGTHLHLVCYTGGKYVYPPTLYNVPFQIYNPIQMPAIGSKVLFSSDPRTCFKPGTTTQSGTLKNDGKEPHIVRGYDPKYPYRILINSKSGGGNGVAVALYYTNGTKIPGWKVI